MTDANANKPKIFTPAWFSALLKGALPTGETFWAGNYGTAMFHQPFVAILVVLPIPRLIPALFWAALTLYQLALTSAVIRSKPGVPTPLGWKLAGIAITLAHGALFASLARSILS
ncbi:MULTISPECIES: hypothetical protein [Shimia]|uniref:hypothetical protein n=1 Tax=Shimia TaxID=573139 RepID=UPI001FB3C70B|nr:MULTISPECIES: hypothetical protein [Shimia]MDV4145996.1 hypothetical protein [Shimia sp. FJ5]